MIIAAIVAMVFSSCADSRIFHHSDGTPFVAKPYGWMTTSEKIDGVEYELCAGNIVWSIVLGETVVAPILFTGLALYEPVDYVELGSNKNEERQR